MQTNDAYDCLACDNDVNSDKSCNNLLILVSLILYKTSLFKRFMGHLFSYILAVLYFSSFT